MKYLVVDTAVFLGKSYDCMSLVRWCLGHGEEAGTPRFLLGLDVRGDIKNEYKEQVLKLAALGERSPLEELLHMIIDQGSVFENLIPARLPKCKKRVVKKLRCHRPIEPTLLGISYEYDNRALVVFSDEPGNTIQRSFPLQLGKLQKHNLGRSMITVKEALEMIDVGRWSRPFPDLASLEAFLDDIAIKEHGGKRTETETLEFKVPNTEEAGPLDLTTMREVGKAVCSFINKAGGYVFLGVRDDGKVIGIKPIYERCPTGKTNKQENLDEVMRILSGHIHTMIDPSPSALVSIEPIDIGEGRFVISIFVRPKKGAMRTYKYDGKTPRVFIRSGPASYDIKDLPEDTLRKLHLLG